MKNHHSDAHESVLAIDPGVRGFGFTYFEGPTDLIDWGIRTVRFSVNSSSLKKIAYLLEDLAPDIVVIENAEHSRRSMRVRVLLKRIAALCKKRGIRTVLYTRRDVHAAFAQFGITTKACIVDKLVQYFPELERRKPPMRQIWETEDPRFSIFDAAALAFTHYASMKE